MNKNYLVKYWRKHRVLFIVGVICVLIQAVCDLLQPRLMSMLVDNGAMRGSLPDVWRYGSMMLGVAALGLVFAVTGNFTAANVSNRFAAELRLDLFKKIQSLSSDGLDSFEDGSLITRETNDVAQIQHFAGGLMRVVVRAPFICVGAIFMAASLNLRAMMVIVPIVAAVAVILAICMRLAYPRFGKVQDALDRLNSSVREYLVGVRLVKAFRRFRDEEARFDGANAGLTGATAQANRVLAVFSPFIALFVHLGVAAILWLGARWVDYGDMQIGHIMAFVSYMMQMLMSLNIISNMLNMFVRVRASHRRVAEVFNTEFGMQNEGANSEFGIRNAELGREDGIWDEAHVRLDSVGFQYRGSTGEAALEGVSFAVRKGETLGIIGPTGSGKSTLAALLLRFYEPTSGEIFINGSPLTGLSEAEWRSRIAIVPQSPTLFTGTIRENIAWGKINASDDEIERASRDAQAYGFITSSPDGFQRRIGQSGTGLSGGQKQRVSIARALVRDPELLVLDDCTSALDVLTETAVKDALKKYYMTTIFITQRMMTARGCDHILVLENGSAAGYGTHEELIESCPVYKDIYRSQIGGETDG